MNELQAILEAADNTDGPMYLATVVDVDGSAYRRPGARMLILPEGKRVGMISGGCLERDLCRQAATLCRNGPQLVSFDTRSDSTKFNARYNLGCSGIIYVLVEPVSNDANCPLQIVREVMKAGQAQVIGTIYHAEASDTHRRGDRILQNYDATESSCDQLQLAFDQVFASGTPICCQMIPRDQDIDAEVRVFVERISPPKPFWIFGAGDDAIPMANVARELGWSVTVVDDQASNLTTLRFPTATKLLAASLEDVASQLLPTSETAAILMTHSFTRDAMLLPWLCTTEVSYVGLLGPKSRTGKLIRKLHQIGAMPQSEDLERLQTPVGLDIGATSPAQIAISIAAEVIALDHQRSGGSLSRRMQPIHEPVAHQLIESDTDVAL